jgi:hypothetical protein
MPDDDYITLAEAIRLASVKNRASLYTAARCGRLKTVTMATGPRPVRLTTRCWLHEYLDEQRRALSAPKTGGETSRDGTT